MSIAQEIEHYATGLGEAYDAVEAKFGTVTGDKNLDNLDSAIDTIPAGAPREITSDGTYRASRTLTTFKLPDGAKKLGEYSLAYFFFRNTLLTSLDFNNVEEITTGNAAQFCCYGCTSLQTVSLPKLARVSGGTSCSNLFSGCSSLTTVSFPALKTIDGSQSMFRLFRDCTSLVSVSFPTLESMGTSYTNQINEMLYGCSNVTVHFPAAMQSVIGSWSSVTSGFSGTNTTVLFDL